MSEDLNRRISHHAVTRYVQRILGQRPLADHHAIGELRCAQIHAEAVGLSIEKVQALILTPTVAAGMALGAARIFDRPMIAILRPGDGGLYIVTTVLSADKPRRSTRRPPDGRAQERRPQRHIVDEELF